MGIWGMHLEERAAETAAALQIFAGTAHALEIFSEILGVAVQTFVERLVASLAIASVLWAMSLVKSVELALTVLSTKYAGAVLTYYQESWMRFKLESSFFLLCEFYIQPLNHQALVRSRDAWIFDSCGEVKKVAKQGMSQLENTAMGGDNTNNFICTIGYVRGCDDDG